MQMISWANKRQPVARADNRRLVYHCGSISTKSEAETNRDDLKRRGENVAQKLTARKWQFICKTERFYAHRTGQLVSSGQLALLNTLCAVKSAV